MRDHDTYRPTEEEEYMNPRQLEYFREKLTSLRRELLSITEISRNELKDTALNAADIFDVASQNMDLALDIEDIERKSKKLVLIEKALLKMNSGEYGYCALTEEEIGLRRLEAQPTATLCIEVQEMLERNNQIGSPYRSVECCM